MKKRITKKGSKFTLIFEEWNDGNQKYQRIRLVKKYQKIDLLGKVVLYCISPIDNNNGHNFKKLIKNKVYDKLLT